MRLVPCSLPTHLSFVYCKFCSSFQEFCHTFPCIALTSLILNPKKPCFWGRSWIKLKTLHWFSNQLTSRALCQFLVFTFYCLDSMFHLSHHGCEMVGNLLTFTNMFSSFPFDRNPTFFPKFLENCVFLLFFNLKVMFVTGKYRKQNIQPISMLSFLLCCLIATNQFCWLNLKQCDF